MVGEPLWAIGPDDLLDNYERPDPDASVVWRPGAGDRWPLFHPSDADPDAGYREHPYAIEFELADAPAEAYELRVEVLVTAPRYPHLEVDVNGATGRAYLRPRPATGNELRLHAALHTTLYGEGELRVVLPGALLRAGANRLVLVARDGDEPLRVENPEAVKRLDRMASAAGLVYQRLSLAPLAELPPPRAEVEPSVVYRRGDDGVLRERCTLHVELAGDLAGDEAVVEVPEERVTLTLPPAAFGHLSVPFELADGAPEVEATVSLAGVEHRSTLRRRRQWRVHVTPHAHTDVGYTHRQAEIGERHARNVDAVLDAPVPTTFHVDSAWTLETWLATRSPERLAELRRLVADGRFSVSGIWVDLLTQTAALEDLARNELHASRVLVRLGAATDFVSVVDVPSLSGSLPGLLEAAGLRYLVHASNQDRGPFRVNGGLHRSSPYWWEGTAGGRVLVWLAKMYCELRKVCGSPATPESAARGLDLWLREYEREDYPLDSVLLYGQEADNTDLDLQPLEFVQRWNEEFEWPRLELSDVSAFFREAEEAGDRLPTVRGDGGAYWEDGAGSAAALTALTRQAQADIPAAERLDALAVAHQAGRAHPAAEHDRAWRQLLLWDEHTWGAFLSARDPDALLQHDQWAAKEQLAWEAATAAEHLLHAAATRHALELATDGREVVVHNPHGWPVSGAVTIEVERDEEAVDPETGEPLPARPVAAGSTQQTVELWVDAVPGLGFRRFPLRRGARRPTATTGSETVLENEHYRLEADPGRGCLASLRDLGLDRELVDADAPWGFGGLVQALGGEGTRLVSNQADLPEADLRLETGFELSEARSERFAGGFSLRLSGAVAGGALAVEWTLRDGSRRVEVAYTWRKRERLEKEAAYVAFPAALPGATVLSDSQLGWVRWGVDDLPGACQEWLPLQTAVAVRGDGCDLLVCSPDVPLFCVGDVVRGRWPVRRDQRGGHVLSYVLNNYWHTNYPASQGGELRFRYVLSSAPRLDPVDAYRRGWEARRPLYGQRISFQDFRNPEAPYDAAVGGALATVEPEHVALVALKGAESGDGLVARFQEVGGREGRARLAIPGRRVAAAWATDLLERDVEPLEPVDGAVEVELRPWGLATVRVVLE